jgi:hypothetical protein
MRVPLTRTRTGLRQASSQPEPELRKVLRWLTADKPDVFNAYQQTTSLSRS